MPFDGTPSCPYEHCIHTLRNCPLEILTHRGGAQCEHCGSPLTFESPLRFEYELDGTLMQVFYACGSEEQAKELAEQHQKDCPCGTGELLVIDRPVEQLEGRPLWLKGWCHQAHGVIRSGHSERRRRWFTREDEQMCVINYVVVIGPVTQRKP